MKALVLNDTRFTGHLGCQLVMQRMAAACAESGIHIVASLPVSDSLPQSLHKLLPGVDLVIINGEGTLHHDAPEARLLAEAALQIRLQGRRLALINTVWQANASLGALLQSCEVVAARESHSVAELAQAGQVAMWVPDLVLGTPPVDLFGPMDAGVDASAPPVVIDDVRLEASRALQAYAQSRSLRFLSMGVTSRTTRSGFMRWWRHGRPLAWPRQMGRDQLPHLSRAGIVITGRFHGICLAILAGRPFVALASNTHKVEGLLADARLGPAGRLLADPPTDPVGRDAWFDNALHDMRQHLAQPGARAAYQAACDAYLSLARQRQSELFARLGHPLEARVQA